jgi:hypothetical protein
MAGVVDFQSFAGAGDKGLRNNVISGYQPASRVGEIMNNAFVDQHEFVKLPDGGITGDQMRDNGGPEVEPKPYFHEWATAHPGMIALSRKQRHTHYRGYTAAEHAVPVVVCAAGLTKDKEKDFFFSGVVRSSSVREIDDGQGPKTDEYFTVSLGGVVTMLNNSGDPLCPGDLVEWAFATTKTSSAKRQKSGPRRFAVNKASPTSSKIIGRALTFAKAGESFDLLIKQ